MRGACMSWTLSANRASDRKKIVHMKEHIMRGLSSRRRCMAALLDSGWQQDVTQRVARLLLLCKDWYITSSLKMSLFPHREVRKEAKTTLSCIVYTSHA